MKSVDGRGQSSAGGCDLDPLLASDSSGYPGRAVWNVACLLPGGQTLPRVSCRVPSLLGGRASRALGRVLVSALNALGLEPT